MPDISKLVDLARMLHISVDRLLGNENEEAEEKAEVLAHAKWAVEHAGDAPKAKKIGMKTLLGLAPFLRRIWKSWRWRLTTRRTMA